MAVILGVAVILGLFVYTQIQISQAAVARAEIDAHAAVESARLESLRSRVAALESPARILSEARRLGMVPPDSVEYVTVSARHDR